MFMFGVPDSVYVSRLHSKRKSPVSADQLSDVLTVERRIVYLTCVPLLKPWPVILLAANFVTMLPFKFLRFPLVQGTLDPRSVAIISSSWTELLGQEVEGFDELLLVIKRHLLAEKRHSLRRHGVCTVFNVDLFLIWQINIIIPRK